jgi:hypothetical protein
MRSGLALALGALALGACDNGSGTTNQTSQPQIKVQSEEQKQLHTLDAFNLAIGLKRAIYDAGYRCKQVTDAGFVGTYKNLEEWMARCPDRDWAIFAGPDGSAQVRDCKDLAGSGLPLCQIRQRPKGSFVDPR